jgi:hypothetical protein
MDMLQMSGDLLCAENHDSVAGNLAQEKWAEGNKVKSYHFNSGFESLNSAEHN